MKKYNWQLKNWPHFEYDLSSLQEDMYHFGINAGLANGAVSQLSKNLQYDAYIDLMVSEAINTSEIEGEHLNRQDIRSSIRNHLGLSNPSERVGDVRAEGIAALMVSTRNNFHELLTADLLFQWHTLVMHGNDNLTGKTFEIGQWRTETMEVVSGPIGYEKTHFVAPPPERVAQEMMQFITWFNQYHPMHHHKKSLPGPVRAAISHIWFESIHPFSDGNGRIGRALCEIILAQDLQSPVLFSLSTEIEKNRKDYYEALGQASRTLNITDWISWFVKQVNYAQINGQAIVNHVLLKASFWEFHKKTVMNKRQEKAVRKLFDAGVEGFEGGLSAKKYISMTKCSKATATRDLTDLRNKHVLLERNAGRSTKYDLNLKL
ncbi:MAG: Fic family protein [gamma proteobacterium symbiont of Bathyaustriella thionipta]|nr:Fic family protein [gamma proteobacterium symbiont of Bathyaustriella thionipta]MCU7951202.1 Fic family protein [gamma proteobacterium symbiont of Bathyaustriella thionipta]MCU7954159.1 Fic family protein [gamma proteobacterium symbiont of Bathyaustriella thionipta]MCU7957717.1 Fic family protein [gamma proteobacterium symbiont of Bathyaustriella thionipta]MCU7965734.1 Fic family protein [gamma proteobacterium symbiont of Bathyaustriella thionipta]